MRRHRSDSNQKQIVDDLRKMGFSVATNHNDCLVGQYGLTLWVEIKNEDGLNKLSDGQVDLLKTWKGAYLVAHSLRDIVQWFKHNKGKKI